ncbi:hypothetical protein O3M35_012797 [Rhynocoris fuscipes]|uniref:Uncharacterized protein n=1 Tax=Rhynocoris fuscipes TaxID=488301 RepID=A0AAW1CGG8_9HEMI
MNNPPIITPSSQSCALTDEFGLATGSEPHIQTSKFMRAIKRNTTRNLNKYEQVDLQQSHNNQQQQHRLIMHDTDGKDNKLITRYNDDEDITNVNDAVPRRAKGIYTNSSNCRVTQSSAVNDETIADNTTTTVMQKCLTKHCCIGCKRRITAAADNSSNSNRITANIDENSIYVFIIDRIDSFNNVKCNGEVTK